MQQGANVLVDDKIRCILSDFGQSEMKSEVFRITGTAPACESTGISSFALHNTHVSVPDPFRW